MYHLLIQIDKEGTASPLFRSYNFMISRENIENLAQNALLDESQFIVGVLVAGHGPFKITLTVDGDRGITIDNCAEISRNLVKQLDESAVEDDYTLEVTTPGVDHPLKMKRQYAKNIGRSIRVQRKDKTSEIGTLVAVSDEVASVEREEREGKQKTMKRIDIPFSEIERAIVQVSFK